MKVIKRNGSEVDFDVTKIVHAIQGANNECDAMGKWSETGILRIAQTVAKNCRRFNRAVNVEEIQELVETELMKSGAYEVAKRYIRYRYYRTIRRQRNTTDAAILSLIDYDNEEVKQENSNKNPLIVSTQRDYMAGEVSKDITRRVFLPKDIVEAHDEGIIHFHDADYFAQHMHSCSLINLDDMLQNGTVISGTMIERPSTFSTACNIATQIIAQVASSQYGGQSISMAHLAPFVQASRERYQAYCVDTLCKLSSEDADELVNTLVQRDIIRGVQTLQYQVITLMTTNGQAPFITVYLNINEVPDGQTRDDLALIIEEMLYQRIEGVKNEAGAWVTPAFPKLIYVLDDNNITPDSEYYHLTELAAECAAKRMVPDFISAKKMRELKQGDVYTCMGCRSFLTPDRFTAAGAGNIAGARNYDPDAHKYYGRFNQGVVTINLPDVALSSKGDKDAFWRILDERLELCYRALMIRHERLEGTVSDVAPILWQHGALARLGKGETIDKLLHGGYSTISLGYAGLCECVRFMTDESHTSANGKWFAMCIMDRLNFKCAEWKAKTDIDFSVYGTPIESTTYKFAKALQRRHGIIEGVSDKNYITNSYHVHVTEPIDAFTKLSFEAEFQALSPGGAISYVEVPKMSGNIDAVLALMKYIYDNIMYAELNTKCDYCMACGYDGEIQIVHDGEKLVWECPQCGNRDQATMSVVRRVCGYLGTNYFNQGRTQEIKERVLHL